MSQIGKNSNKRSFNLVNENEDRPNKPAQKKPKSDELSNSLLFTPQRNSLSTLGLNPEFDQTIELKAKPPYFFLRPTTNVAVGDEYSHAQEATQPEKPGRSFSGPFESLYSRTTPTRPNIPAINNVDVQEKSPFAPIENKYCVEINWNRIENFTQEARKFTEKQKKVMSGYTAAQVLAISGIESSTPAHWMHVVAWSLGGIDGEPQKQSNLVAGAAGANYYMNAYEKVIRKVAQLCPRAEFMIECELLDPVSEDWHVFKKLKYKLSILNTSTEEYSMVFETDINLLDRNKPTLDDFGFVSERVLEILKKMNEIAKADEFYNQNLEIFKAKRKEAQRSRFVGAQNLASDSCVIALDFSELAVEPTPLILELEVQAG